MSVLTLEDIHDITEADFAIHEWRFQNTSLHKFIPLIWNKYVNIPGNKEMDIIYFRRKNNYNCLKFEVQNNLIVHL